MADRIILNRATDSNGDIEAASRAYFDAKGTTTPLTVYSDEAATTPVTLSGPDGAGRYYIEADSEGVFIHVFTTASVKVTVTDSGGVNLPGYPSDPHPTSPAGSVGAANISFAPTSDNPSTTAQTAIQYNSALIAGAAFEYIDTYTVSASVASLEMAGVDSTEFDAYMIQVDNLSQSASENLLVQVSVSSSWKTGATDYRNTLVEAAASVTSDRNTDAASVRLKGNGNSTYRGEISIVAPHSSADKTSVTAVGTSGGGTAFQLSIGSGFEQTSEIADGIRIIGTAGTIDTAVVHLFGKRTS